jgi:hypothetical protein
MRSIHQLSISSIVHYYCVTVSIRVWVSFPYFFSFFVFVVGRGIDQVLLLALYAFSWRVGRAWVACFFTRLALEVRYSEPKLCAHVKRALNTFEIICLSLLFFFYSSSHYYYFFTPPPPHSKLIPFVSTGLRELPRCLMKIHHPIFVRPVINTSLNRSRAG